MKKSRLTTSLGAIALLAGALATDAKSPLEKLRDKLPMSSEAPAPGQTANTSATVAGCALSGATGELSKRELIATLAARKLLDSAAKRLRVDEVQLPERIENVCQAKKRFVYVQRSTSRWSETAIESIEQAKEAVGLSQEIESYQAFKSNPNFGPDSEKDISRLQKDMKSDLEKLEKAIAEKSVVNQAKLEEASASMRAALGQGALIAGWDQRMVEFIGSNARWAFVDNLESVKMFKDHIDLLGSTFESMTRVVEASGPPAKEDKKAAALRKKREKENQEYEKKLLAELQL